MTMDIGQTIFRHFSFAIFLVFLCSVCYTLAIAQDVQFDLQFDEDPHPITSTPANGSSYTGERKIHGDTQRILDEKWNPEKVPSLITYTISCYAKGPGTLTLYLGGGSRQIKVGAWESGDANLSNGSGNYEYEIRRPNRNNYSFPEDNSYKPPYDDSCVPYENKGYKSEITENLTSVLSIDGGKATFNGIDTHVGGANTSKKTLIAAAGWKKADVSIGYSSSSTKSWIHRPSATSLSVPTTPYSLDGTFSVEVNDTEESGSRNSPHPPLGCVLCPAGERGCNNYVHTTTEHQLTCPFHGIYYRCIEDDYNLHRPRNCNFNKWPFSDDDPCGQPFRNCTPEHCLYGGGPHSDVPDSSSSNTSSPSVSLSGSSSASAGDSVVFELATATPFSSVYWYVAGPGDSGLGSHIETDTGGSSSTTESFTYTFPSDATSGDWTITAYIYNYSDSSTYETSYTVNVSGSRWTVSDDTPNCSDCTSHCSSPCSCTNSGTCNGSVYTPPTPPQAPTPPPTVACGGAAWTDCRESVSSRTEHKVSSCSNCGKHYWTCMSGAVERHTEVKTCKRTGCGASLTRCQNGPEACSINGGYHWL